MTDEEALAEQLVDSLNSTYGSHSGHRAAHASGVLCAATFTPSAEASELSTASHFAGPPVRAHVRFSNGSGDPNAPDHARDGRGMAIKCYLPEGSTTDVIGLSLPAFFARTPQDLLEFNAARRADPVTGQPDVAKVGEYLAAHPEAVPAVTAAITHPIPASYATLDYHSLHAFGFVDAGGAVQFGRYHLLADAGAQSLTDDEAASKSTDYLRRELEARLAGEPVVFYMVAQLAADGDAVDDPTAPWPDDRVTVRLGQIEVTAVAHDREQDGDVLVFDPTRVPEGIVLPADPILHARSAAYRVSVARRTAH